MIHSNDDFSFYEHKVANLYKLDIPLIIFHGFPDIITQTTLMLVLQYYNECALNNIVSNFNLLQKCVYHH